MSTSVSVYTVLDDDDNDNNTIGQQQQQSGDEGMSLAAEDSFSTRNNKRKGRNSSKKFEAHLQEPLTRGGDIESNHNMNDPFHVFREDLYRKLDLVDEALAEYLRIVHQTDAVSSSPPVKDAKKQFKRHAKNAESTLRDVQTTVKVVETQRDKFPHVDNTELYERRSFVTTSQDRISRAKSEFQSTAVKQKLSQNDAAARQLKQQQQQSSSSVKNPTPSNLNIVDDDEADHFLADSQAQTSLLMQRQDETLDELGHAVERVGEMAETIHEEIEQQNQILTEMEDDLADAEEKLGLVMGKLAKLLKTKNKWQLCTILALCAVVVVLFILVFVV